MFRRVFASTSSLLFRNFTQQKPPQGFEKFFKKQSSIHPPPSSNQPDSQRLKDLPNPPHNPDPSEHKPAVPDPELSQTPQKEDPKDLKESKQSEVKDSKENPQDKKDSQVNQEPPKPSKSSDKKEDEKKKSSDKKNNNNNNDQNIIFALLAAYLIGSWISGMTSNQHSSSSLSQFINEVSSGRVRYITIKTSKSTGKDSNAIVVGQDSNYKDVITIKLQDVSSFVNMIESKQPMGENIPPIKISFQELSDTSPNWDAMPTSISLGQALLFISLAFLISSMRTKTNKSQGGVNPFKDMFNFGKSNFKVYGTDKKINTTFKDVAGQKEAKREISEFVEFLKNPEKYAKLGARMPRGALLVGPPGTGKTLLAKASAGEAGVPFFATSGSEFVEMFVGVGASRVRELFKQAREKAPSIIFIDEIDAVGRKRDDSRFKNDERDSTLNQLLVEMDGFQTDTFVVVMAATNRQDTLDNALLRPGRFDRIVEIGLPDIDGREQILKVHLAPIKLAKDFDIDACAKRMAALTPGFSGADLSQVCNEAAILAAREGKESVESVDFERASEKVMLGAESNKRLTPKEKKIVSFHEAGHAVAGWFLEGADPVIKVSILPRSKGSLGFAQNLPKETMLFNEQEFLDRICMILGGRVSELLFFGTVTNGASDDLKKATQLAQALIENFGMSKNAGLVSYNLNERYYSESTKDLLDREVKSVIDQCLEKTKALLDEKRELIIKLAEKLMESERLNHKDLIDILGKRPFEETEEYKRYVSEQKTEEV
jgi:AFG3 family protein